MNAISWIQILIIKTLKWQLRAWRPFRIVCSKGHTLSLCNSNSPFFHDISFYTAQYAAFEFCSTSSIASIGYLKKGPPNLKSVLIAWVSFFQISRPPCSSCCKRNCASFSQFSCPYSFLKKRRLFCCMVFSLCRSSKILIFLIRTTCNCILL